MQFAFGFLVGLILEEVTSAMHWFGDPHRPAVSITSGMVVGLSMWLLRRRIWPEEF